MGLDFLSIYFGLILCLNAPLNYSTKNEIASKIPDSIQMMDVRGWKPHKGDIQEIIDWLKNHPEFNVRNDLKPILGLEIKK